jgi:hypothetical protein
MDEPSQTESITVPQGADGWEYVGWGRKVQKQGSGLRAQGSGLVDAVGFEDVAEGDYAFEFVDVGAVDDREQLEVVGSDALEGEVEALIGVDVGEGDWIDQGGERPAGGVGGFGERLLKAREGDDA